MLSLECVRELRSSWFPHITDDGLDRQADGGTHVRSTDEVGLVRVVKTESKGKANKRIRLEVL